MSNDHRVYGTEHLYQQQRHNKGVTMNINVSPMFAETLKAINNLLIAWETREITDAEASIKITAALAKAYPFINRDTQLWKLQIANRALTAANLDLRRHITHINTTKDSQ